MNKNKNNQLVVVKGRHNIINNEGEKIENFVFDGDLDVKDIEGLQEIADRKIAATNSGKIHIYITGLTVAVISVINAVIKHNKEAVFWHFDRETETYYPQRLTEYLGKW